MRFVGRSCSSSGQRRQLRPPWTTSRPGRTAEAPAVAAAAAAAGDDDDDDDAGVAGSGAADVAADAADVAAAAAVWVTGGRNSPDTGNQCTG